MKTLLTRIWQEILFRYHRRQLSPQYSQWMPEYRNYLETQLRRTLTKRQVPLPARAQVLIDKIAQVVDIAQCEVLCVGCRNMAEITQFRRKGAKHVVGIDLYSSHPDIVVMDMHAMQFSDNQFDLIYSSHSLEHSYDVRRVVREIVRVARSQAWVAIEVPIQYETRGADLVDFGSLENLYAVFVPYLAKVLWSDERPAGDQGPATICAIFTIQKSNGAIISEMPEWNTAKSKEQK